MDSLPLELIPRNREHGLYSWTLHSKSHRAAVEVLLKGPAIMIKASNNKHFDKNTRVNLKRDGTPCDTWSQLRADLGWD